MPKPEPIAEKVQYGASLPPHPKLEGGLPLHIIHELLELREKVGKLEGIMEVLLFQITKA